MKLRLEFEPHDCLPPKLVDGLKRALVATLEAHGIAPDVRTANEGAQMEAYTRFFAWNEARLNGGNEGT